MGDGLHHGWAGNGPDGAHPERGRPENVHSDNGPKFSSRRMLGWAEDWKVASSTFNPEDRCRTATSRASMGDECLNASWFRTLDDVREKLADWQQEYNHERPHSSLDYRAPAEFQVPSTLAWAMNRWKAEYAPHSPDDDEITISKQTKPRKLQLSTDEKRGQVNYRTIYACSNELPVGCCAFTKPKT